MLIALWNRNLSLSDNIRYSFLTRGCRLLVWLCPDWPPPSVCQMAWLCPDWPPSSICLMAWLCPDCRPPIVCLLAWRRGRCLLAPALTFGKSMKLFISTNPLIQFTASAPRGCDVICGTCCDHNTLWTHLENIRSPIVVETLFIASCCSKHLWTSGGRAISVILAKADDKHTKVNTNVDWKQNIWICNWGILSTLPRSYIQLEDCVICTTGRVQRHINNETLSRAY